jgi:hypothetical protein
LCTNTVCSSSLIYLLDLERTQSRLWEDKSTTNLLLESHKIINGDKSTGLFLELTLKELVFLCCKF